MVTLVTVSMYFVRKKKYNHIDTYYNNIFKVKYIIKVYIKAWCIFYNHVVLRLRGKRLPGESYNIKFVYLFFGIIYLQ